ncbi:MAG: transposase [Betaproteobacteria bacterium]|nr:MAG: transposase [Betaproteobacteria bacterium]
MNRLSLQDRAKILGMLVEGNSMRAASRMADVSINTVTKLLEDVGFACGVHQDEVLRNLSCKRIQCDEIWSFCYAKQKNVAPEKAGVLGYGDVYTWTAIDAETKLVPSFLVGRRDAHHAEAFVADLASRMASRIQLTTDGLKLYINAVEDAFGADVDYAMLVKLYGEPAGHSAERKYSPGECCGTIKGAVCGNPSQKHISTSYVERQNLTMRMGMRRFTRLTNGFSKKIENLEHAVALHFMFYNFGRVHKTLRVTPAMEAGKADHIWTLAEIAALADAYPRPKSN